MRNFKVLVEQLNAAIQYGQTAAAGKLLSKVSPAKIPREWCLPLANACRRAGLYATGLSFLTKVIQEGARPLGLSASPNEIAEYGALLLRMGARDESIRILKSVDTSIAPEALLYRSFGNFTRWEFEEALPCLEAYLTAPISDYAKLVGGVNLAGALVELKKLDLAEKKLNELISVTESENFIRLQSNCYGLRSQLHMMQKNYSEARRDLAFAERLLDSASPYTNDRVFLQKTGLVIDALESGSAAPLDQLRELARTQREWEFLRAADLHSLQIEFNYERYLHLIFGTPFRRFRERVGEDVRAFPDRDYYVLGAKSSPRLDLMRGLIDGKIKNAPTRKSLQLIDTLLRDFYQPARIASLFFELFPGENFDVLSSPNRVHQTISRTRAWIKREKLPVAIKEEDGFFSLEIAGDFSFCLPLDRQTPEKLSVSWQREWEILILTFSETSEISTQDIGRALGLSRSSVQRLLRWAVAEGRLIRFGQNRETFYKLLPTRKSA